jgi:multidrug efflux pump subunit AcrA (membrane-fusion protein)
MYASVEIPLHQAAKVLAVPTQVVQPTEPGKGTVLVVNDSNQIERRTVALGLQTASEIEILSGLKENERVIFGSQGQYQPGQRVVPKLMEPQETEP